MAKATVVVKAVYPPKEGKKQSKILAVNGMYYGFYADKLQFEPGATYEVEYESRDWEGKPYHTATKATKTAAAAATNGAAPATGGGYAQTNKETQMHIFVCGALNHAIGQGQINVLDEQNLLMATETLKRVWRQSFGEEAKKKQEKKDEFDDEIPF